MPSSCNDQKKYILRTLVKMTRQMMNNLGKDEIKGYVVIQIWLPSQYTFQLALRKYIDDERFLVVTRVIELSNQESWFVQRDLWEISFFLFVRSLLFSYLAFYEYQKSLVLSSKGIKNQLQGFSLLKFPRDLGNGSSRSRRKLNNQIRGINSLWSGTIHRNIAQKDNISTAAYPLPHDL